jgi:hypothetical protein
VVVDNSDDERKCSDVRPRRAERRAAIDGALAELDAELEADMAELAAIDDAIFGTPEDDGLWDEWEREVYGNYDDDLEFR